MSAQTFENRETSFACAVKRRLSSDCERVTDAPALLHRTYLCSGFDRANRAHSRQQADCLRSQSDRQHADNSPVQRCSGDSGGTGLSAHCGTAIPVLHIARSLPRSVPIPSFMILCIKISAQTTDLGSTSDG